MNINLLTIKNNNKNNNNSDNNLPKKIYHNYFTDNKTYEKEARRMLIEYVKVLNQYNNINDNNNSSVKQILSENNISKKILNQKYKDTENDCINQLFGEAKKELYLKNLNYSLSNDSLNSNNDEDTYINNLNNNLLNVSDLNDLLLNKNNKKINILNYLCMPRILNLIQEGNSKEKIIFLITLDEKYFTEAKKSYRFQWRNMNNELVIDFNLKDIKSCNISNNYNNRFIIEIENAECNENFEIEAPSKEICFNYVMGINYLIKLIKKKK